MAKLPTSLRNIDSRRAGGCQKPACRASGTLHRHHIRHEAMWLGVWSGRRRNEPRWHQFVARYYEFRHADCIILCPNHHAEIHKLYDAIIKLDRAYVGRPIAKYSWPQAEALMDKLAEACEKWLKTKSPGIDSKHYGKTGKRRAPK